MVRHAMVIDGCYTRQLGTFSLVAPSELASGGADGNLLPFEASELVADFPCCSLLSEETGSSKLVTALSTPTTRPPTTGGATKTGIADANGSWRAHRPQCVASTGVSCSGYS